MQPTEDSSAPLQCGWLNAYRPSAFSLQTPGLEFLSLAPCSSLWLEHSQGIALCCLGFDLLRVLFYLLGLLFSTHARDRKGYLVTAYVCRGVSFWPWLELKHPFHSRGALALSCRIIHSSSINSPAILRVKGITTHWTDGTLTLMRLQSRLYLLLRSGEYLLPLHKLAYPDYNNIDEAPSKALITIIIS